MTAWKDLERRICNALGGRRAGPLGASVSDCVNTPFAVEVKRCAAPGPPVYARWIAQAKTNAKHENRPWLIVVAGHNDRRPIIAMDFFEFVRLAQQAGRIGVIDITPAQSLKSLQPTDIRSRMRTEAPTEPAPAPEPEPEPDEPDTDEAEQ